jgi:hypothetical protein
MRFFERESDLPPARVPEPCPLPVRRALGRGMCSLAGWLLLLPGVALLIATSLIASGDELNRVLDERDRVLAIETYEQQRLERLEIYVAALESPSNDLQRVLEATHLNQFGPGERALLHDRVSIDARGRVVLAALEPERPSILTRAGAGRDRAVSRLERWSTDDRARLWLIGAGAALIMLGLVPWGVRPDAIN